MSDAVYRIQKGKDTASKAGHFDRLKPYVADDVPEALEPDLRIPENDFLIE